MICNWGILGPGFVATRAVIPAIQQSQDARVLAVASRGGSGVDVGEQALGEIKGSLRHPVWGTGMPVERAQQAAATFGIERIYYDYQTLLNDPDIHAVYIALPNHLHHVWTIHAAEAGKHVLCEKPLAMNATECDEMIAACQRANVLLMEAVMYRFHPRMLHLRNLLVNGELGDVRLLHTAFSFPFNQPDNYRARPEFGGGALLDIGSYCVNAARWLTGSEPQHIQAETTYGQETNIDMSTSAVLRFNGNVLAHMQCSFVAAEHQVIEVVGSQAAVTAPHAFTAWRDDRTVLMVQRGSLFERIEFPPADPYQLMVAHFTDCVLGRAELLYPAIDGRETLRVIDRLKVVSKSI
jgi:xylose dehydrogenase (NAD/NADP)